MRQGQDLQEVVLSPVIRSEKIYIGFPTWGTGGMAMAPSKL